MLNILIAKRTGSQWSAIRIIAHEVGHHIACSSDNAHRNEFYADYWSGWILQRLGATSRYPGRTDRIKMVRLGWAHANEGRMDDSFCDGPLRQEVLSSNR